MVSLLNKLSFISTSLLQINFKFVLGYERTTPIFLTPTNIVLLLCSFAMLSSPLTKCLFSPRPPLPPFSSPPTRGGKGGPLKGGSDGGKGVGGQGVGGMHCTNSLFYLQYTSRFAMSHREYLASYSAFPPPPPVFYILSRFGIQPLSRLIMVFMLFWTCQWKQLTLISRGESLLSNGQLHRSSIQKVLMRNAEATHALFSPSSVLFHFHFPTPSTIHHQHLLTLSTIFSM